MTHPYFGFTSGLNDWARFWIWLTTLLTIFGGVELAAQRDLEWAFLGVVGLAAAIAFGRTIWIRIGNAVTALRNYRGVLEDLVDAREKLSDLQTSEAELKSRLVTSFVDGIAEGRSQVASLWLSSQLSELPTLTGATLIGDDLRLLASFADESPIKRANLRFLLIDGNTQDVKGVVRVDTIAQETREIELVCVEERNPAFWTRLRAEAPFESALPESLHLAPYRLDPIEEERTRRLARSNPEDETNDD